MLGYRYSDAVFAVLCVWALAACSGGAGSSAGPNLPSAGAAGAAGAAQGVADPAIAADIAARTTASAIGPLATTIDTCTLTSPCISGTNTSSGAGVGGISTNGRGVSGTTKHNSTAPSNAMYGLYGQDLSTSGFYNGGVFGTSVRGKGVYGVSSSNYGVYGTTVSGTSGVAGTSSSSNGVDAISTSGLGLYAQSSNSYGTYSTGTIGVFGYGPTDGMRGATSTGLGVVGTSAAGGVAIYGNGGNGADVTGGYLGLIGRAPAGGGTFPLVLTDSVGNNLLYVNGNGDLFYHGSLAHFSQVSGGAPVASFSATATRPSIEDTGTARLISGQAVVRLDPAFARAIDTGRPYQVLLTPGGDTRGLYVAAKNSSAFVVREVQGGRGSFDFDYHVYATQFGANQHMSVAAPNARSLRHLPAEVRPSLVIPPE